MKTVLLTFFISAVFIGGLFGCTTNRNPNYYPEDTMPQPVNQYDPPNTASQMISPITSRI